MSDKVTIRRLASGVPGLDAILGGGLPEFSFNLIVGPPGSGKTTLAHQIMFSLAARAVLHRARRTAAKDVALSTAILILRPPENH
jgi:predicted ATP-dependent serine protease